MAHQCENCNCLEATQKLTETDESDNCSIQQKKSLLALTRSPVQCPIGGCNRSIGITYILSHYLRDHHEDFGVKCQEIYLGKRSVLIFDPSDLDSGKNICLGVLAYGGHAEVGSSRPAERGLSIHNYYLPDAYVKLDAHLPILIMACRTSWTTLLPTNGRGQLITIPESPNQDLLVLWLVSEQTTKPVHCTLTLYDKLMTSSRSAILKIRCLNNSQNPRDFVLTDTNCLRLNHGEMNILSQNRTEYIRMEIIVNEYE